MLSTTFVSCGKTFTLHPREYPDLNRSEAIFLARLAMITKGGTQPCWYTDKQVMEEFNISRPTASRIFSKLLKLGYITSSKVSNSYGRNIRQVEVNPVKLKQTVFAEVKQSVLSPCQQQNDVSQILADTPAARVTPQPVPAKPLAPKSLNSDIAAAMARPIAGDQPLVKPENWGKLCSDLWKIAWEQCDRYNKWSLLNRCHDIAVRYKLGDTADGMTLLDVIDTKAKLLGECQQPDLTNAAIGFFTYYLTAKFLRDHKDWDESYEGSFQVMLKTAAIAYINSYRLGEQPPQETLAAKLMDDLEFPAELKNDPRMTDFLNTHLIPRLQKDILLGTIMEQQLGRLDNYNNRAVNALNEPVPLARVFNGKLRRKRELLTYAPAEGVDPRGLPCYQPFTNMVKFDLGPALDQTKFGRFPCYDLEGNLHDFKFDFSALAHLLSPTYHDKVTTFGLKPWEFGYTTCFDSDPCLPKAISDYLVFALVTELIAPMTAENVFYSMQDHQEDSLLELFQDPNTHCSLLMFACDVLYPATSDNEFDARPIFNYIRNNYCAGPKSEKDFAAFVVANNVVRALGDKEQSAKIFKALKRQLVLSSRAAWVDRLRVDSWTSFCGVYDVNLHEVFVPNGDVAIVPRLTYPFMLIRKLFGIRGLPIEDRAQRGTVLRFTTEFDAVAQRDLSVLKSTYVADYPFLAQLGGDYE